MKNLKRMSVVEQTAEHLRRFLNTGDWSGRLPGIQRLADEVGVSKLTMRAAMRRLEAEGVIRLSEDGYSRYLIEGLKSTPRSTRIGILLSEPLKAHSTQFHQLIVGINAALERAGFLPFILTKNLESMNHNVKEIERELGKLSLDACCVMAGSRGVLEWFASNPMPCLAFAGRSNGLPIARTGPEKLPAYVEIVERLLELGHRRIVLLTRKERREPSPGRSETAYLNALAAGGINVGEYNLPGWKETPEGFLQLLEKLFKISPPTAIIVDDVALLAALQQYFMRKGLRVPEHVSLVMTDDDPSFHWCHPTISHIRWEEGPIIRRIVRWARCVAEKKIDQKETYYAVKLEEGGTIGRAYR